MAMYEAFLHKQCLNKKKSQLQNIKKYVSTFEHSIPLKHKDTDRV